MTLMDSYSACQTHLLRGFLRWSVPAIFLAWHLEIGIDYKGDEVEA